MSVPRFDLPFRYRKGQAVTNKQGSLGDIAARVYAACTTEPGWFDDDPTVGLGDLTFSQEPIEASRIAQMIGQSVPDAQIFIESEPSKLEEMTANIGIRVVSS